MFNCCAVVSIDYYASSFLTTTIATTDELGTVLEKSKETAQEKVTSKLGILILLPLRENRMVLQP